MRFTYSLDRILGQKSKIRALRYLVNYTDKISIRELARAINIAPANLSAVLKELEHEGVFISQKYGRTIVFSVNKDHYLNKEIIIPLFQKEKSAKKKLAEVLESEMKFEYISVILFGSCARGDNGPQSDIDLLVLVPEATDDIENKMLGINPKVISILGNSLAPVIIGLPELRKKLREGQDFWHNIVREGEVLTGKLISEIL